MMISRFSRVREFCTDLAALLLTSRTILYVGISRSAMSFQMLGGSQSFTEQAGAVPNMRSATQAARGERGFPDSRKMNVRRQQQHEGLCLCVPKLHTCAIAHALRICRSWWCMSRKWSRVPFSVNGISVGTAAASILAGTSALYDRNPPGRSKYSGGSCNRWGSSL